MRKLRRLFAPAIAPACFLYEGRTTFGASLRVLAVGVGAFRHYFAKAAFEVVHEPVALASTEAENVGKIAGEQGADLILVSAQHAKRMPGLLANGLLLPNWLSGSVRLNRDDITTGHNYHRRRDIRIVRESKLTYHVTADSAELTRWYESMYVPLINASHGDAALQMDREDMLRRAGAGEAELIVISQANVPVGGALLAYDKGRPRVWSRGILNADRDLQRAGVGAAIYLFAFEHLLDAGHGSVDIGRVRPFLRDSGLHYKKKNGFRLDHCPGAGFVLADVTGSAGSLAFFQENPLVHIRQGDPVGLVVISKDESLESKALGKTLKYCEIPGLSHIDVVRITNGAKVTPGEIATASA